MRMEICRRTSTAMTQLWLNCRHEKDPSQWPIGKLRCSIFDVSDKCVRKGVSVRSAGCAMYRERNAAQTKYSLWWPAQWALYHTRQVTTPVTTPVTAARSSHLLTPTSVP